MKNDCENSIARTSLQESFQLQSLVSLLFSFSLFFQLQSMLRTSENDELERFAISTLPSSTSLYRLERYRSGRYRREQMDSSSPVRRAVLEVLWRLKILKIAREEGKNEHRENHSKRFLRNRLLRKTTASLGCFPLTQVSCSPEYCCDRRHRWSNPPPFALLPRPVPCSEASSSGTWFYEVRYGTETE